MEERSILEVIEDRFPKMSKSHKKIAEYILNHYDKAVFMTAAQLGKKLEISESTVVRFADALGLSGFPQLQKRLEVCVQSRLSGLEGMREVYHGRSHSEVLNMVMKSDMDRLQHTIEHLDADAFDLAVETILSARRVYVMGLRSNAPLAGFLQFYLSMIRRDVVLLSTTSITETFEQMMYIGEQDCFVGISFPRYSMRTLKAMEFANARNARVIALTDNIHSPMLMYSSCNLLAKSEMVSIVDSLVAPLSVINALVVALVLKCPGEVKKNMETLEQVWSDYQVYLKDEINFMDDDPILSEDIGKEEA